MTFNVGYHVEHHDFMNIPGWRLPEYRPLMAPHYAGFTSHASWTRTLWDFVTRDDLGPRARLVRLADQAERWPGRVASSADVRQDGRAVALQT